MCAEGVCGDVCEGRSGAFILFGAPFEQFESVLDAVLVEAVGGESAGRIGAQIFGVSVVGGGEKLEVCQPFVHPTGFQVDLSGFVSCARAEIGCRPLFEDLFEGFDGFFGVTGLGEAEGDGVLCGAGVWGVREVVENVTKLVDGGVYFAVTPSAFGEHELGVGRDFRFWVELEEEFVLGEGAFGV